MDKIILPIDAAFIIDELRKNGFEGHIVGGCVRDSIMGIKPHDYDITTSAKPEEVKNIFPHTFDTGIQHGTVTVVINKQNYEVTTFRIDGEYEDCRHPKEVNFTRDIHEDLLRRDFTMNAIAYNPYDGYTDIFGGIDDIGHKIIRGVGDPDERFKEDALRILRAVRFSAQLGFEIEPQTKKAMENNVGLIKNISSERIREELTKLLISKHTEKLPLLWQTGLLENISQRLAKSILGKEDIIQNQISESEKTVPVRFAILTQFISPNDIKKELSFYKFDNKTLNQIICLNSLINEKAQSDEVSVRHLANKIGIENSMLFYCLKKAQGDNQAQNAQNVLDTVVKRGDCIFVKDMELTGKDLIALGVKPGKEMGQILNALLDMVINDPKLNTREILIKKAKENFIDNI